MAYTPGTVFAKALEAGASDVHLVAETPLLFRIDGELLPQTKQALSAKEVEQFIRATVGTAMFQRLQHDLEVDCSAALKGGARLRINCHYERGHLSLAARIVPAEIPTITDLGLAELMPFFADLQDGLVLFTGPTGSGKSTSLAAILQEISAARAENIITLEDPIEFLFPAGKGVVRQRQLGEDFHSFAEAMRRVLRQDPDIVMVGEMRDPETVAAALTLAETGHLIFATLHTPNTVQSVDRIIDVFPPHQQNQIRAQLSLSLKAVVSQRLLPKVGGGRIAQREVLIASPAIGNVIRENRLAELRSYLQTGSDLGMRTFEKDAKRLYKEGVISKETFAWAAK